MREAPPEMHRKLMRLARQDWRDLEPRMKDVHAAREAVVAQMAADPFDGKELTAAIARLAEMEKQAQIATSDTLVKMLELLSVEQRQRLSQRAADDRAERRGKHHRSRRMDGLAEERPPEP